MARYRATILGNRGEVSRLGTKEDGIESTINGWDIGCKVSIECVNGEDILHISITRGSNNPSKVQGYHFKESELKF